MRGVKVGIPGGGSRRGLRWPRVARTITASSQHQHQACRQQRRVAASIHDHTSTDKLYSVQCPVLHYLACTCKVRSCDEGMERMGSLRNKVCIFATVAGCNARRPLRRSASTASDGQRSNTPATASKNVQLIPERPLCPQRHGTGESIQWCTATPRPERPSAPTPVRCVLRRYRDGAVPGHRWAMAGRQ